MVFPSRFSQLVVGAVSLTCFFACAACAEERIPMTNARLDELLKKHYGAEKVEGGAGVWRIQLADDEEDKQAKDEDAAKEGAAKDGEGKQNGDADDGSGEKPKLADELPDSESPEDLGPDEPNEPAEDDDEKEDDGQPAKEEKAPGAGDRLPATMVILTDANADRMRLMMPIRAFDPQKIEDLRLALIVLHANYDRALDARYATQDGILWSVFIHPLQSLTADDLENGLNQVKTLRKNTGTTYTSSELLFGPAAPANQGEEV